MYDSVTAAKELFSDGVRIIKGVATDGRIRYYLRNATFAEIERMQEVSKNGNHRISNDEGNSTVAFLV